MAAKNDLSSVRRLARERFGYEHLRPGQEEDLVGERGLLAPVE